jgi:ADP-ribose pyrophosphatase
VSPIFRTIYQSEHGLDVKLEVADVEANDGTSYEHHRLIVADGRVGAVIIACRGDDVLLVRSARPAAGLALWELPRGSGEITDSSPIRTALRELREETGFRGREPVSLGRYITDSTVFPQAVVAVSCTVSPNDRPGQTDGEVDELVWVSRDDLRKRVVRGEIQDARATA